MITAGVDVGSLSIDVVIFSEDKILGQCIKFTGSDNVKRATEVFDEALAQANIGLKDIDYIVATGYGRMAIPFSNKSITEISCHAKGINWFFPEVRTLLDMGGQDCKVIQLDSSGKTIKFLMNDKCAAGTGRAMEMMADITSVPLQEIGQRSFENLTKKVEISSMCMVFAKSEVRALLMQGVSINDILAGYCEAMAQRVCGLIKRVGVQEAFAISGGIAKNIGVVKRIEEKLGTKANICYEPQIVGALGAAIFAQELAMKQKKTTA